MDASWRCYLDPDAIAQWSSQEFGAVLIHEVSHLLREHHARGLLIDRDRSHVGVVGPFGYPRLEGACGFEDPALPILRLNLEASPW